MSLLFVAIRTEKGPDFWGIFLCMCQCPEWLAPHPIGAGYNDLVWPLTTLSENINNSDGTHSHSLGISILNEIWN